MPARPPFIDQPAADVCRFCGRLRKEARALLGTAEHELAICDGCIDVAGRIVAEKRELHAAAVVAALPPVNRRHLVVVFAPSDKGRCDFCGKAHHEVKTLLAAKLHPAQICDQCVELCGEMEAGTKPARKAPAPRAGGTPSVDDQISAIIGRFREGPSPGDEAAYNELRLRASSWRNLPRTYDGFRCSFCDEHWCDVDLLRGPVAFICHACVVDALAVVQSGPETAAKRLGDLLREDAEKPIATRSIPERVLEIVTRENVDEVMRALPDDMRVVMIAYVQETFASGVELVYFGNQARSRERNEALCDWVRREGRFHFPRRADEPSIDEINARLDPPSGFQLLRTEPFRILRYVGPHNVDKVLADLDAEVRDAVVAWAKEALAGDGPVTGWRMRPGAVDAMRDWLRRHGAR